MKLKMKKIDGAGAMELLTAHVEKIVFGVFVLAFLLFCYGAIFQKPYDKRPDQFTAKANEVKQTVDTAVFDRTTDVPPVPKAPEVKEISATAWATHDPLSTPVVDIGKRRPEPRLLAARDLRVGSGYAAVATIPPEGLVIGGGAPGAGRGGFGGGLGGMPMGGRGGLGGPMGGMPASEFGRTPGGTGKAAKAGGTDKTGRAPGKGGLADDREGAAARGGLPTGMGMGRPGLPGRDGDMPGGDRFGAPQQPTGYGINGYPVGKQWVVVTALVPLQDQIKEYRAAFLGTHPSSDPQNATRDQEPLYVGYEAQRIEIPPGTPDDAELKDWVPVNLKAIRADEEKYAGNVPDLIEPIYYAGEACRPLPPLMGNKVHDKTVVHPKIPQPQPDAQLGAGGFGGFGGMPGAQPRAPAAAPPNRGGMPMGLGGMGRGGPRAGLGAMPGGFGGLGGRPQTGGARGNFGGDMTIHAAPKIEYLMFRFFDFKVSPGKSYRYKVRLLVANPNYGMPPRYLAAPSLAEGMTRPTAWSDPSPVISAPRGSSLLAGSVDPQKGSIEPKASFLVRSWNPTSAVDATKKTQLVRGQVANITGDTVVPDLRSNIVTTRNIKFDTDSLVLDMTGGDVLTGAIRAPGQTLVLEPDGALAVRSELAEADSYTAAVERLKELEEQNTPDLPAEDRTPSDGRGIDKLKDPGTKRGGLPVPGRP